MDPNKIKGDVIACSVQKGGVGKSGMANAIAYHYAEKGEKVILVDLDPQASQTGIFMGYQQSRFWGDNESNITNLFKGEKVVPLVKTTIKYVDNPDKGKIHQPHFLEEEMKIDFIPSNKKLLYCTETDEQSYDEKIDCIVTFIQALRKEYSKVIIDCPPSFGIITKAVMITVKSIVTPIPTKSVETDGLVGFFDELDELYDVYDMSGLDKILIVPNMFDKRVTNSKAVLPQIKRTPDLLQVTKNLKNLKCKVMDAFPQRSCVQEAPAYNMFLVPFVMDYSRANKDLFLHIENLVKELDK